MNDNKTVCRHNGCTGCMACINVCPQNAIKIEKTIQSYNAIIDEEICINCSACTKVCQVTNPVELKDSIEWYQGWASDAKLRKESSSGGIAYEIMRSFISNGGFVSSCCLKNGEFSFECTNEIQLLNEFRGSKYVKSDLDNQYSIIKSKLLENCKVLFVGLPCQSASLQKYLGNKLCENLFTIDLICHGTPSPIVLERFFKEHGKCLNMYKKIIFRKKEVFCISGDNQDVENNVSCDKYSIAFLNSMTYTENCYECSYASKRRVSDLTLGDSWGSLLAEEEQKKGISLILCQSDKGKKMLLDSNLTLCEVDIKRAIQFNYQLNAPAQRPRNRDKFYKIFNKYGLSRAVWYAYPWKCIKQTIVKILNR